MSDIKIGDVVKLKSGGPEMTVVETGEPNMTGGGQHAWCRWFQSAEKCNQEVFPIEAITKVS